MRLPVIVLTLAFVAGFSFCCSFHQVSADVVASAASAA